MSATAPSRPYVGRPLRAGYFYVVGIAALAGQEFAILTPAQRLTDIGCRRRHGAHQVGL